MSRAPPCFYGADIRFPRTAIAHLSSWICVYLVVHRAIRSHDTAGPSDYLPDSIPAQRCRSVVLDYTGRGPEVSLSFTPHLLSSHRPLQWPTGADGQRLSFTTAAGFDLKIILRTKLATSGHQEEKKQQRYLPSILMAGTLKRFLGYGQEADETPTAKRSLPASWYRSPEMYELERRAIFSKKWILVTHRNRFENPGDYVRITEAGFSFFLCLGKDGVLRGFHNICRHRGFPLLHNDEGNAKILACKYHGWSYGINGKLAKAPHFENFSNFDKDKTGLLPIHVHVDQLKFVWVNLEASKVPTTSWEEQLDAVDQQKRLQGFDFSQYRFDHSWGMQGEYNWKTLADNYNECLHCRTAHPDTAGLVEIEAYRVEGKVGHLQHYNKRQEDGLNKLQLASTYYFPNACMTVTPDFFYMMRCVPTSVSTCSMEYEVYRKIDGDPEEFDKTDQLFKRVLNEDKWLCNETQKSLEAGIYINGPLHPDYESGPVYFQSLVRKAIYEHRKEEEKHKSQIWPAAPTVESGADEDEAFCTGLSCGPDSKALAW